MWTLFWTFCRIGVLTFGGGYAMLPMIQKEVVEKHKWATDEEVMDYFAIGQCTPGVIAVNTVIEADIYGNTNSSHIGGSRLMNGLGGSGDFGTNAGLSIYITPATAKKGTVSSIVPFVTHVDHTEHDIHALITEYGVADIRGLSPIERAHKIIDNCAAPEFREELNAYLEEAIAQSTHKQTPHVLHKVFK